jgi:hypothetical protein
VSFKKSLMSELATVNGFCIQLLDDLRHADRLDIVGRHNETAQSHTCSKRMADATRFLMLNVIAKSKGCCSPDVRRPFQTKPVWIRGAHARLPLTHTHTHMHARAHSQTDRPQTDRQTDRHKHARTHTHTHGARAHTHAHAVAMTSLYLPAAHCAQISHDSIIQCSPCKHSCD